MFKNVGEKIKSLAVFIFILLALIPVGIGLGMFNNEDTIIFGIVLLIGGPLIAWLLTLSLYGMGELIDNSKKINENLLWIRSNMTESKSERIEKLNQLYTKGFISKEEYSKAMQSLRD